MSANLEARLETLSHQIEQARAAVADGASPELAGLDDQVSRLCRDIHALPRADGQQLLPALQDVLERIEDLDAAMKQRFDDVKAELQNHGRRTQAAKAYGRSAGPAARGPRED